MITQLHKHFQNTSKAYSKWHHHPLHQHAHWGVTFVVAIVASAIIIVSGFRGAENISLSIAQAAPVSVFVPFADSVMQRHANDVYTPYNPWDWDLATMLFGLWRAYEVTGDTAYRDHIKWYLDQFIKRDGSGNVYFDYRTGVPEGPNELATFYVAALMSEESVPDAQKYEIAARNAANHAVNNWGRTSNGGFDHRFDISNGHELWLDTLFMVGPALAKMGQIDGNNTYFNEAANQFIYHLNVNGGGFLQDSASGLLYHGWDAEGDADWMWLNGASNPSTEFWGRGNGWVAAAFAEVLSYLPAGHSRRSELLNRYRSFLNGLASYQGPNGMWYTLLDYDEPGKTPADGNYLESSGTALITYSFLKAKHAHILEEMGFANDQFDDIISAAVSGLVSRITDVGGGELVLNGASEGTNPGNVEYYLNRNQITNRLWGDGAALMALSLSGDTIPPPPPPPPPPPGPPIPVLNRPVGNIFSINFEHPVGLASVGDFDGDNALDMVIKSLPSGPNSSVIVEARLQSGRKLWEFDTGVKNDGVDVIVDNPADEAPMVVWDFDNDGKWEVYFQYLQGGNWRHRIVRWNFDAVPERLDILADAPMPYDWSNLKSMAAIAYRGGIPRIVWALDYTRVVMFDTYNGSTFSLNEMWNYEDGNIVVHDSFRTADVDQNGSDDEILIGCAVINANGTSRFTVRELLDPVTHGNTLCGGSDQVLLGYYSLDRPNELVMITGDSEGAGRHVAATWARTGELLWAYFMPDEFSNNTWTHFHDGWVWNNAGGAKLVVKDRNTSNWALIDVTSGMIEDRDITLDRMPSCPGWRTIKWDGTNDQCTGAKGIGRYDVGSGGCEEVWDAVGNTLTIEFNPSCPATAPQRWEASVRYRQDVASSASGYNAKWISPLLPGEFASGTLPPCTTSSWTNNACGAGGCSATQMHQTRTVSPAGCAATSQCVFNATCVGSPVFPPEARADLNCSNRVDAADFTLILYYWNQPAGTTKTNWNMKPDINGDGVIGIGDISVLMSSWMKNVSACAVATS